MRGLNWNKEIYVKIKLKWKQLHLVVILIRDNIMTSDTNNIMCHTKNLTRDNFFKVKKININTINIFFYRKA